MTNTADQPNRVEAADIGQATAPTPDCLSVFVHIFKNAGTSIDSQIKLKLGRSVCARVNDGKIKGEGFSVRLLSELKPETKVLAGHFSVFRVAPLLGQMGIHKARYFSFVREPVARVISSYNYHRINERSAMHEMATLISLSDYVEELLDKYPGKVVNHQCKVLSADGESNFDAARDSIECNFAFVGVVDRIEAINDHAQALLGLRFDSNFKRNTSGKGATQSDLSPSLLNRLVECTEEDRKLYDFVKLRTQ